MLIQSLIVITNNRLFWTTNNGLIVKNKQIITSDEAGIRRVLVDRERIRIRFPLGVGIRRMAAKTHMDLQKGLASQWIMYLSILNSFMQSLHEG